jgi:CheY-like chemotaxis protein
MPARRPRVLSVDDHADICQLVSTLLDDYQVVEASSVGDALKRAEDEKFDLFLLDYFLPDGNGIDLCKSLKLIAPDTPVIFVTIARPLKTLDASSIGFEGVIEKHHISDQLPQMVAKVLSA